MCSTMTLVGNAAVERWPKRRRCPLPPLSAPSLSPISSSLLRSASRPDAHSFPLHLRHFNTNERELLLVQKICILSRHLTCLPTAALAIVFALGLARVQGAEVSGKGRLERIDSFGVWLSGHTDEEEEELISLYALHNEGGGGEGMRLTLTTQAQYSAGKP